MCMMCQTLNPSLKSYDDHVANPMNTGGVQTTNVQGGTTVDSAGLPVYSVDQVADYLTTGFWTDKGYNTRSFNVSTGGTLTVDMRSLGNYAEETARKALDAWTAVSGLNFVDSTNADITFSSARSGAYNSSSTMGNQIIQSRINIEDAWTRFGDYYLQTYIHEIGHALGLGHSGDYNGSANFGRDAHFANDSWQTTVMSYFDQNENPNTDATRLFLGTAQLGDIAAIQQLYGKPTSISTGDSIYGDGSNTGQFGMDLPSSWAVAIVDNGGTDLIDLASRSHNQTLDLRAETYSDINGRKGNLSIGRDTVIENASTGNGADFIVGNGANNRLSSGGGNDTILGNGGNDTLIGGDGSDDLTGGTGADRFVYNALSEAGDTIHDFSLAQGDSIDLRGLFTAIGYTGDNPIRDGIISLQAAAGGSYLMVDSDGPGGAGGTQLVFLAGVDASSDLAAMTDTAGTPPEPDPGPDPDPTPTGSVDTIYRISNETIEAWGRTGEFIEDTDGGTDTLDLSAVTLAATVNLESGVRGRIGNKKLTISEGTEIENVILGSKSDRSKGNASANEIDGRNGNDRLYGLEGDDVLTGGEGSDMLYGGADNDTLHGDAGRDRLYGGDGNDIMTGGDDADQLRGEAGDDQMDGGAGNDTLFGHAGNDNISGGDGNDYIKADIGDDIASGGAGHDRIYGNDGHDQIDAGAGRDRVYGGDGNDVISGGADADTIRGDNGNDTIHGDGGNDRISGGNDNDTLTGGEGSDYLKGGKGDDDLDGGAGRDKLYGDSGNDILSGGGEDDYLQGGSGNDVINGDDGKDKIDGGSGNDTITGGNGMDNIDAGSGNDRIDAGRDKDKVYAGSGDDWVSLGSGDDYARAGSGDDTVFGGDGNDNLIGESGTDMLDGGAGNDKLDGGSGNDLLTGGAGADSLKGGSGTDTFVFNALSDAGDTILDFNMRYGEKIEVSGLLSDLGYTVADAISNGILSLNGVSSRNSWLEVDSDGAGGADAVSLVLIRGVAETTELSETWLI